MSSGLLMQPCILSSHREAPVTGRAGRTAIVWPAAEAEGRDERARLAMCERALRGRTRTGSARGVLEQPVIVRGHELGNRERRETCVAERIKVALRGMGARSAGAEEGASRGRMRRLT